MTPTTAWLLVAYAFGVPGGVVVVLLSWWLLTSLVEPALVAAWWEYALVAAYLLAPVWAPLLAGIPAASLANRLGWVDWDSACNTAEGPWRPTGRPLTGRHSGGSGEVAARRHAPRQPA